jgi:hypothetical protein
MKHAWFFIVPMALISGFISGFCLNNIMSPTEAIIGYWGLLQVNCESYDCLGIIYLQTLIAVIIDGSTLAFSIRKSSKWEAGLAIYSICFLLGFLGALFYF